MGISDRETVEQIRENPDLQYFIGLTNYQKKAGSSGFHVLIFVMNQSKQTA